MAPADRAARLELRRRGAKRGGGRDRLAAAFILGVAWTGPVQAEVLTIPTLVAGVEIGQDRCAADPAAVWVEALKRSFCFRYYLSDAGGPGTHPVVMLQGDQLGPVNRETGGFAPPPDARAVDTATLARRAENLSRSVKGPAIYVARIGLDGSSGNHIVRRTILELHATDAALEAIKMRHGFGGFHFVGQSGGATLVAGLLGLRTDIGCAVLGSGQLAFPRSPAEPEDPALRFFDPSHDVARIASKSQARILVVTDSEDRKVPAIRQTAFAERLQQVGGRATQLFVTATDPNRHAVTAYSVFVAIGCINNWGFDAIERKLATFVARRTAAAQEAAARANHPQDQPHERVAEKP